MRTGFGRLGLAALLLALCSSVGAQVPSFCGLYPQDPGTGWSSTKAFYQNGRMTYPSDSGQNRIPDYSYAGYNYGVGPLPSVPERARLSATTGDQTARIQAALDALQTPGALVLNPGTYEIRGTLNVNRTGLVLRGSGDGTTGTVLRATGNTPSKRNVIVVGSGTNSWTETGAANITTSFVPVGSRGFDVASTSGYTVGQEITVHHPSTQAWINAVDCGGGSGCWSPGTMDVVYLRKITAISGTRVTIDAPVYHHLNRSLSQSYIAHVSHGAIRQAAVESLRIDIVTAGPDDENHAWNGIYIQGAHDSWIRGVTALHFGYAGIRVENGVRITVEDCHALDPHAVRTGGNMYNFTNDRRAQLVLYKFCRGTNGRHTFVANGMSLSSGITYYRCTQRGGGSEGGHRNWTTGVLYDNHDEETAGQVLFINRGDAGSTIQGWSAAHSTVWKYDSEMVVQKPPTAQNYAVSNAGSFRNSPYNPGPWGSLELRSGNLVPTSLYEAQLCERLAGTSPTPTPTPTPTATPSTPTATPTPGGFSGYYRLTARHSGKAVVVQSASTANSANVFQWAYGGTATNDEWQVLSIGSGYYRVINRNSGKDMVVQSASTADVANIFQYAYGGTTTNDEWAIVDVGGGYYRLTNRHSGKSAEVAGGSTADGANVNQRTYSGAAHQQFQLVSVP